MLSKKYQEMSFVIYTISKQLCEGSEIEVLL